MTVPFQNKLTSPSLYYRGYIQCLKTTIYIKTPSPHLRTTQWEDPRVQIKKASNLPLPPGWEERYTLDNTKYFVDHNTRSTTFQDPRVAISATSSGIHYERSYRWKVCLCLICFLVSSEYRGSLIALFFGCYLAEMLLIVLIIERESKCYK